jgi:hypothetical protein
MAASNFTLDDLDPEEILEIMTTMDDSKFEITSSTQYMCLLGGTDSMLGESTCLPEDLTSSEAIAGLFQFVDMTQDEVIELLAKVQNGELTDPQFRRLMMEKLVDRKDKQRRKEIKEKIAKYRTWMDNPDLSQLDIEEMRGQLQLIGDYQRGDVDEEDLIWIDETMDQLGRSEVVDVISQGLTGLFNRNL